MLQYSMHQDPKRAMGPFNGPVPTQQVPYINAQQFQQFPAPLPPPPQHVAHALQVQAVPVQAPARHVLDPTLPDSELAPFVPNTSVFVSHTPKPFQCGFVPPLSLPFLLCVPYVALTRASLIQSGVVPACDKKYRQLTGIINHHYERHRAAQPDDDPERLFRCEVPLCGQLYKQAGGLAYHIERSHAGLKKLTSAASRVPPEQKPYGCNENDCGKRFKSPNGLAYHKEKGHGKAGVEKRAGMFACNGA